MSLIEEALRKQREEEERANTSEATPPPADQEAPPPLPEETPENPGSHRPWPILAGLAAAGLAAVLVICALLYFGFKLWYQQPESPVAKGQPATVEPVKPPAASPAVATSPAPPSPVAESSQPAKEIPAAEPETQGVMSATAPAIPPPSAPPVAAPAAAPAKPSLEKPATPIAAAPVPAPVTAPAAAPAPIPPAVAEKAIMPVIWPRLSVSGIIGNNKTRQSAAIINGQFVSPGDSVEGVKVIGVDRQRVTLMFSGETRTLSAGTSTE